MVVVLAGAAPLGAAPKPVVRFAFTGDIAMVAGPVQSYFSNVSLDLAGDVVLGNLEGTLTDARLEPSAALGARTASPSTRRPRMRPISATPGSP